MRPSGSATAAKATGQSRSVALPACRATAVAITAMAPRPVSQEASGRAIPAGSGPQVKGSTPNTQGRLVSP
jgi:hypothetical protein